MYELKEDEYRNLDYIKKRLQYSPPERLLRLRKSVLFFGVLVLFYYIAGITVDANSFSGGYLKGKIERPEFIPAFLCCIFLYYYYMFWTYLGRESSTHNFKVNSLYSFGIEVARNIIKREIGKFFPRDIVDKEYEPKNFSIITSENAVLAQFILDAEVRQKHEKEIQKLPGFSLDEHVVKFEYKISQADKKFYEENRDFFKKIVYHEFMEYKFPEDLGEFVALWIMVTSWYIAVTSLF